MVVTFDLLLYTFSIIFLSALGFFLTKGLLMSSRPWVGGYPNMLFGSILQLKSVHSKVRSWTPLAEQNRSG